MPRISLKPGEDNIASRHVTDDPRGGYRLQWDICLHDGRVLHKATRGKGVTKGEVKARARAIAADLLRQSGDVGDWKSTDRISDYIRRESVPAVAGSTLRPNSKARYLHILDLLASELSGYSIADGSRPRTLKAALNAIASAHGTASAEQARKVANKWLMRRLFTEELIDRNPLHGAGIEITVQKKASPKAAGGVALTSEEYDRVMAYMLACDPADPAFTTPKRGRYTKADLAAKRESVVGMCLLQAATGLRMNEARLLRWSDVAESGGEVLVTVRPEVSKTHRGRTVQVLDAEVASRLLHRLGASSQPSALVFPSPLVPDGEWDRHNCSKAVNGFLHHEVAEACHVDKLRDHGSHIWRATLSTIAMQRGVPDEVRAAAFGHSADVNRDYYTDVTDISGFTTVMKRA